MILVGNGLFNYEFVSSDHCGSALNYIDRAMIEHFGPFEEVDTTTATISVIFWLVFAKTSVSKPYKVIVNGVSKQLADKLGDKVLELYYV